MARPLPLVGAAACLAAGVSLWFTRASLDVLAVDGRETRVAMFPSWPELAGLCVLVFLVAAFAWPRLARLQAWPLAPAGRSAARAADLLIPLFALLWVAVPYLPWMADAVPAWRALAGPAKYGVWLLVGGHLVWLASGAAASPAPRGPRVHWRLQLLAVFVASAAIYGAVAVRLARGPIYPGGDEPHYLVITQSLLADGDLDISDNHARRDYRAYFQGTLKPDAIVRGSSDAVYSIHPVGLPVLLVPAFALGGYRGVLIWLVGVAALAATLMWRMAVRLTGSAAAATLGWIAVALSAPWVLHAHAVYPEVTAAAVVLLAVAPAAPRQSVALLAARGLAPALLPWLSAKYAPLSLVLVALLAWRTRAQPALAGAVLAPWLGSVALWLFFFDQLWGSWLPSAPYGPAHQLAPGHLLAGLPGLLLDQEYGLLPYAPALGLAGLGLWQLWKDGGEGRYRAIETCLAVGALAGTVGAYAMWWGGSAPPGRQLVAVLPLLALPIARWAQAARASAAETAFGRTLVLAGLALTAALVLSADGLLIANRRDGSSALLEWLAPGGELVRSAPSAIRLPEGAFVFAVSVTAWLLLALLLVVAARTSRVTTPGAAAAAAIVAVIGGSGLAAAGLRYGLESRLPPPAPPGGRVESALLDGFDARRRPMAVVYDPWRVIDPDRALRYIRFDAAPGLRRHGQPVRVLLNMRLSLPAGRYRVTLEPAAGEAIDGSIGLQVGRMGRPLLQWAAEQPAGRPWQEEFELPVDSQFVGLRVAPALERRIASVRVEPLAVVNASDRPEQPPVLSAARYGDTAVMFHGTAVYPEANGFWVRGRSTLVATIALPPEPTGGPGIRLSMHAGARQNRVDVTTPAWRTTVLLEPGVPRHVAVPAPAAQRVVPIRISPRDGFVPADIHGGGDRRLLGCWVEVLP
jgi:hypothetical protein